MDPSASSTNSTAISSGDGFDGAEKLCQLFNKTFIKNAKIIAFSDFQFNHFDSWFNNMHLPYQEFSTIRKQTLSGSSNRYRIILSTGRCTRRICLNSRVDGTKTTQAYDIVIQLNAILNEVNYQMESDSAVTPKPVESEATNTVVEGSDGQESGISVMPDPVVLSALSNTETTFEFPQATNRFQILDNFSVTTSQARNSLKKVYKFPRDLLSAPNKAQCSSNTMPFQNFAYADCDIEIKILCNGARFATGRLIAASFPDPYEGFDDLSCRAECMYQRPDKIMISMSKNNEGSIIVENDYRRTFVRNFATPDASKGVSVQQFASLQIEILSPYAVTAGQPNTCYVQVLYRFVKCNFAGAAYGVEIKPQAPPLENQLISLTSTLFPAVAPVEKLLKRTGIISNQDKPYGARISTIVPQPRMNFSSGVGLSDSIPLKLDHASTVTLLKEHMKPQDPKTMLDIAKIDGIERYFTWKTSDKAGANICSWPIVPTACHIEASKIKTVPTPLKFATSMYQLWRGTIELTFHIISNDYHTGTLQIETSFNRTPSDLCGLSSTYTKTFALGEEKEIKYTVPYIYDTAWRRTNRQLDDNIMRTDKNNGADDPKNWSRVLSAIVATGYPTALAERVKAFVNVTVLNPLNPIASAPNQVEIIMSVKAGNDYNLHSMMPNQFHTAYRDEDYSDTPWFGRFPNFGFLRDDSRADDPIFYASTYGDKEFKPNMDEVNNYKVRSDEGLALISKSIDKTKKGVYFQGPFSPGPAFQTFHTTDVQHRLKDILRRPIRIWQGKTLPLLGETKIDGVTGKCVQSLWIPCHVPNHFDGLHPFSRTQTSLHASIATLFRHWRGSMRFTLFFHSSTNIPIYVTYVPNTGVRYFGPHRQMYQITNANGKDLENDDGFCREPLLLCDTGLGTEPVICSVNPSFSCETAFDVNLNRCVVSKRVRNATNVKHLMGREEISDIAGHLIIQSSAEPVTFDLFWHVGDDFELSSFVGTPYYSQYVAAPHGDDFQASANLAGLAQIRGLSTKPLMNAPSLNVVHGTVNFNVDFHNSGVSSEATRPLQESVHYQMDKIVAGVAATTLGIGTMVGTKCVKEVSRISNSGELFLQKAGVAVDKINDVATKVGTSVSELLDSLMQAFNHAKRNFSDFFTVDNSFSLLVNFFLDLFLLVKDFSPMNLAIHVAKLLNQLVPNASTFVLSKMDALVSFLSGFLSFGPAKQQSGPGDETPMGESLFGILIFVIGSALNIKYDNKKKFLDLKTATIERFTTTTGLLYLPAALSFAKHLFSTIKAAASWLLNSNAENTYKALLADNAEEISTFIADVELLTHPLNARLIQSGEMRQKLWTTYVRASQLSMMLAKIANPQGSQQLIRYIEKIKKFAEEKSILGTCCPVRREPFVLCVEGPSNIGKSFLSASLNLELLKAINAPIEGNPVYTRVPGLKHWDGYSGQPAIVYDDWLNLSESQAVVEQVSELFVLKSTSDCILPMANLSEKGIKANPFLVMLLTNDAFPNDLINSVAHTQEAVYRRRDVLIKARKRNDFRCTPTRDIGKDVLEKFGHLEFAFYDPLNYTMIDDSVKWIPYEQLLETLITDVKKYTTTETDKVQQRLQQLKDYSTSTSILDDPTQVLNFGLFKIDFEEGLKAAKDPEFYLSERLKRSLEFLKKTILQKENEKHTAVDDLLTVYPQMYRPGPISSFINMVPKLGDLFEKGYLPHLHNKTTTSESIGGEFVDDCCAHCKKQKFFYFGPSHHLVCISCRVPKTIDHRTRDYTEVPEAQCPNCEPPKGLQSLSARTAEKIRQIVTGSKERYEAFMKGMREIPFPLKITICYSITMMGVAFLLAAVENQHDLNSINSNIVLSPEQLINLINQTSHQAPPVEEEWIFNEERFQSMMEIRVPRLTTDCQHSFLEEELPYMEYIHPEVNDFHTREWKVSYGAWSKENGDIVPLSPCGDDCWLLTPEGKVKYRFECEEYHKCALTIHKNKVKELSQRVIHERIIENCTWYIPPFCLPEWIITSYNGRDCSIKPKQWLISFLEKIKSSLPEWASTVFKYLALGTAVVGFLFGAHKLVKWFSGNNEQIMSSGSYQVRHFMKEARKIKTANRKMKDETKYQSDEVFQSAVQRKIHNNSMNFEIYDEGCLVQSLGYTGVANRVAILPNHYLDAIRVFASDVRFSFKLKSARFNTQVDYKFVESDFMEGDADISIFNNPKTVHNFSNIIKFMAKASDFDTSITSDGYILQCKTLRSDYLTIKDIKFGGIVPSVEVTSENGRIEKGIDALTYNFSKPGACGSLVMRYKHTRPILAMHFAGTNPINPCAKGYGVLLTQETFEDILDFGQILESEEVELKPAEEAKSVLPGFVQVQALGASDREVFIPTKTKIKPSNIQHLLPEPETLPGFLSMRDPGYTHEVSPLVAGCSKHGELTNNFTTEEIEEVSDALWTLKYSKLQPSVAAPKRLTIKESITGFDVPGYTPLHLNTSMGYDWVFGNQTQKKHHIKVDRDEHGIVQDVQISTRLYQELARVEALRRDGIIPFVPYVDELKDERRALAKRAKLGSTRVFCMASILTSIPNRQNFLHFAAAYTNGRIKDLNHAVGISTDGPEWGALANHLLELSDNIVTLDYSNFGPGYNAMVNAAGHDIIANWTEKYVEGVDALELSVLGEEHYNSVHIMGNLVYRQLSGGPSGDALTVVKNGLVNELYMLLAWKNLMSDYCHQNKLSLYESFYKLTRLIVYGDDLIMSVHDDIKELYNGVTIKNFFSTYKITATDALKTGADIPYTSISEATFLKCSFVPHPTRPRQWLAPLEERSIYETAKWVHDNPNQEEATRQVAEASILNAYGHGPEFYTSWMTKVNSALVEVGIAPVFRTWIEIDKNFFE